MLPFPSKNMTTNRYLLDTNIIVAYFKQETTVVQKIVSSPRVILSTVVLGELYFGARKSGRVVQNLDRIEKFREDRLVLTIDVETSQLFGILKRDLEAKGITIPDNDIWIAAIAMRNDLTVVTRDAHFRHIGGLHRVRW